MKVHELIDLLQSEDPDAEVHFAYDYGDHAHSRVAPKVRRVEEEYVVDSAYHRMPVVVDDDDKRIERDAEPVVVLC